MHLADYGMSNMLKLMDTPGSIIRNSTTLKFHLKVTRDHGPVQSMSIEAPSPTTAIGLARDQGYTVIASRADGLRSKLARKTGTQFPLVLFSHELQVLLKAGLNVVEALEVLAEREQRSSTREIYAALLASLREGHTLSRAMSLCPEVFPPFFVASVRASETSGEIATALARYVEYQSNVDLLKKKIVSASVYPILLIFFGALVLLFLLGYVVPRFSRIYADHGGDLSMASRILLGWGQFMQSHGTLLLPGMAAALCLAAWWLWLPGTRARLARLAWNMPNIGEKLRLYQLTRLYRTLAMLLRSGIPIITALDMVRDLLAPSPRLRLAGVRKDVSEGRPLSEALEHHGMATAVAFRLARVAEQTGGMSEMLEHSAKFHEEEMMRWVDMFTRLFEPLLMSVIGIVIGAVVLLMYMPIFELAGSIQ